MSFDQSSKAEVPFSWELKPGVSRKKNRSGRDQFQWKLKPPPCPQAEYSEEVLPSPVVVCPFTPTNMVKTSRSNLSSFRKKDVDPFLEAYMKCLEHSPIRISSRGRKVRTDDQDCYKQGKKRSSLWSKYSCKFGTDGLSTVSRFRKKRVDSTK